MNIKKHWCLLIATLSAILVFGSYTTNALAQVKVLSNSRHAFTSITAAIDQLLGAGHVGTDIIVHSTNMNTGGGFIGDASVTQDTDAEYYDETGATTTSAAPYQMYTSSYSGYYGDNVNIYNEFDGVDLTHNYAYQATASPLPPPTFMTAPGRSGDTSKSGVEWILDGSDVFIAGTTLSERTARNAGMMTAIRYNHPSWNWYDVKAAVRQTATNWDAGYDGANYGFGVVSYASSTALTDGELLLQPPAALVSTSSLGQITFTLYPYKQTRRIKEVLFQFASDPGFQADELSYSDITGTLGATKVMEWTNTTATSTIRPYFTPVTDAYFVWLTTDDANDNTANFSRIDTYAILGPISQEEISFSNSFSLSSPSDGSVTDELPTFSWTEAESYVGIAKYQLYIDGSLHTDNITGTSTTLGSALTDGSHTWYVVAENGNGATTSAASRTIDVVSGYAASQTWYVDNVLGNDSNDGTISSPWATLAKAATTAQPGNTVIVVKNDDAPYRETLTPAAGNTQDGNITFRGVDAAHKPEIWGSTNVSQDIVGDWAVYGGGNPDTYQRTMAFTNTIAAGVSTDTLSQRVNDGNDQTVLGEGEWAYVSGVLYYRLQPSEDINLLHIEAGTEPQLLTCTARNTFKDIIVRYATILNVSLGTGCIGERLESYGSGLYGAALFGAGTASNLGPILRYSTVSNNKTYGVSMAGTAYARMYNNTVYNNGTGLRLSGAVDDSLIHNNIFFGNTQNIDTSAIGSVTGFVASHNNWANGSVDTGWQNTYQGTNNQASTSPLLTDPAARDFSLDTLSPSIDAGTDVSLTSDTIGNPIYGSPDIGALEYQPPYTIGVDTLNTSGPVRIYADGKYRYTSATSSSSTANLQVSPIGGFGSGDHAEYMNLTINTWETDATDATKEWTASSSYATSTTFTISGLAASTAYEIEVDNAASAYISGSTCDSNECTTNGSGNLNFTYSGGWSTHTFTVTRTTVSSGSSGGGGGSSSRTTKNESTTELVSTSTASSSLLITDEATYRQSLLNKISELQNLIKALTAQLLVVQSKMDTQQFTRPLDVGDEGHDVLALQMKLNRLGFTIADSGPGSPGLETLYYGPLTTLAIQKFQCHYNIVCEGTPQTTGFGNFGPQTRAKLNSL